MLIQRILTALVLFAFVAGSVYLGDVVFLAVMALALGAVTFEWLRLCRVPAGVWVGGGTLMTALMLCLTYHEYVPSGAWFLAVTLAVSAFWLALLAALFAARYTGFRMKRSVSLFLAVAVPFEVFFSIAYLLKAGSWPLVLSVFALVWTADIFAYFAGRAFGRRRLAPALSPKKSWEGVAGGMICVFALAVAAWFYLPHSSVLTSRLFEAAGFAGGALMTFLLVALSITGDLFESALKRQAGVKDSGNLLPGHGGFFDRMDASLSVLPCAVALLLIL